MKKAVVEVKRAQCPFAIEGGGHSSNSNGSCIHDGFQFDLVHLNQIEIADNKQTVPVGPGVRWGDLFRTLEKHGVIAVGRRDFGVGVPGFIFGGQLCLFSNPDTTLWVQMPESRPSQFQFAGSGMAA